MPSVIQKKSCNSVKVFWLNKELLETNILNAVNTLANNCPEVKKVILFGSIAENRGVPSSLAIAAMKKGKVLFKRESI